MVFVITFGFGRELDESKVNEKVCIVQISSVPTQQCHAVTFSSSPRNFRQLSTEEFFCQLSTEERQLSSTVQTSYCRQRCMANTTILATYRKRNNTTILATEREIWGEPRRKEYYRKNTILATTILATERETWVKHEGKTLPTFANAASCSARGKLNSNYSMV